MLTPFWQVPFHAFSELAGSGFLDLQCDDAGEPDGANAQPMGPGAKVFAAPPGAPIDGVTRRGLLDGPRPVRHD